MSSSAGNMTLPNGRLGATSLAAMAIVVLTGPTSEWLRADEAAIAVKRNTIPGIVSEPIPLAGGRRWQMYTKNPGGSASNVAWSPDGRWLAIASGPIVRLYDFQQGSPEFNVVLAGHQDTVTAIRFDLKGERLATASLDGTVRLWHADGREQFAYRDHEDAVQDVSWHPDGNQLASGSSDGTLRIWSTDGTTVAVLRDHEAPVNAVAWHPNGKTLTSGCENKTIRFWSDKGVAGPVVEAHVGPVRSLAWNANGSQLLSCDFGIEASSDGDSDVAHMKVWDTTGALVDSVLIDQPLSYVSWSPDGTQAVAGSWRSIKLWKIGERQAVSRAPTPNLNGIVPVAWHPSGDMIAAGPLIVDPLGVPLSTMSLRVNGLHTVSPNRDGTVLGTGGANRNFSLFSHDGEQLYRSPALTATTFGLTASICWSPDGTTMIPGLRYYRNLQRYDLKGAPVGEPITLPGDTRGLAWSRDGKMVATGGDQKVVALVNLETAKVTQIGRQNHGITKVRFTPDQTQICSAGFDGCIRFWSLDGKPLKVLEAISAPICGLSWSEDGKLMATGHQDNTIRLWNGDGELLTVVGGHGGHVESVEFSPDGTQLVSGSRDNSVRIWKSDGTHIVSLQGHLGAVFCVQWTPDGKGIYSCSEDGTVRRWNAETGVAEWQILFGEEAGYVTLDSYGRVTKGNEKVLEEDFVFFAEDNDKRLQRTNWDEIRSATQSTESASRGN